jgi:hypothetical protein
MFQSININREPGMFIRCNVVEIIKLEVLRELVSAGAVTSARLLGQKGGYRAHVRVGGEEQVLANKLGKVRVFASTDSCINELARAGLTNFTVDVSGYEKALIRGSRKDLTTRAKRVTEALEYDEWFRARVKEALDDDAEGRANWTAHDDVWASIGRAAAAKVAERKATYTAKPKAKGKKKKDD